MPQFILTEGHDLFPTLPQNSDGDDTIEALGGDDVIDAGAGANLVYAGDGNDVIRSNSAQAQVFDAGNGNDYLFSGAGNDQLFGGAGGDVLWGGAGDNRLFGGEGDDELFVSTLFGPSHFDNLLDAGAGNDLLMAEWDGIGQVRGGLGDDTVGATLSEMAAGIVLLSGDAGSDRLKMDVIVGLDADGAAHGVTMVRAGDHINVLIDGTARAEVRGFESLWVTAAIDSARLIGGAGNDSLQLGEDFGDRIHLGRVSGGAGDDVVTVIAASGRFDLDGGAGNDVLSLDLFIGSGPVTVDVQSALGTFTVSAFEGTIKGFESLNFQGGTGNDVVHGGDLADVIGHNYYAADVLGNRELGDDLFYGGGGADRLYGAFDKDTLYGGAGDDLMQGGYGADLLYGGAGNDTVDGESFGNHSQFTDDKLYGGAGNDILYGGVGADTMAGGLGADTFVYRRPNESGVDFGTLDNINSFTVVTSHAGHIDRIDLSMMDANVDSKGNAKFSFIGQDDFSAAGQLRVVQIGHSAYVEVNTGGTLEADMRICLVGAQAIAIGAEDFIL